MVKRYIDISDGPVHLGVKNGQLVVGRPKPHPRASIPIEDIAMLSIGDGSATITSTAMSKMLENNVAILVNDSRMHPVGLMQPLQGHSLQAEAIACQINARRPRIKRAWQLVVKAKILNQSIALRSTDHRASTRLRELAGEVRSADSTNREAVASRIYWKIMFGSSFKRERLGPPPNSLLNYGYTVVRALVARSVCMTGLHPSIGIHHHNRYNNFCLADDLIESFRPAVDVRVRELYMSGASNLTPDAKAYLIDVVNTEMEGENILTPLELAVMRAASSLRKFLAEETNDLTLAHVKS